MGYRYKDFRFRNEYRNTLAAILRTDPRKIFELPGDYDHIPEPMSQEEMKAQAIRLGYADKLGIKAEC